MIQAVNMSRWYFNNLTHFGDKVDIVYVMHFTDVTLLFEQWIIFKNLQFILLFLDIWTLTFYCFMLKNVEYILSNFRVSNHCWAFSSLLWLSNFQILFDNSLIGLIYFPLTVRNHTKNSNSTSVIFISLFNRLQIEILEIIR